MHRKKWVVNASPLIILAKVDQIPHMKRELPIEISPHAKQQMVERGATETEVITAIQNGEVEPVRKGRMLYRKNFQFHGMWRGRRYRIKQVAPVVATEENKLVAVTVYVFYY